MLAWWLLYLYLPLLGHSIAASVNQWSALTARHPCLAIHPQAVQVVYLDRSLTHPRSQVCVYNNIFSGDLLASSDLPLLPPTAILTHPHSSEHLYTTYPAGDPADVCPQITGTCKARIMAAVNRNYAVVLYCDLLGSAFVVCNKLTPPTMWRFKSGYCMLLYVWPPCHRVQHRR